MGRKTASREIQPSGCRNLPVGISITKQRTCAREESDSSSSGRQLSALQKKFRRRLQSGQFREINEMFYTNTSCHATEVFKSDPALYSAYHAGFTEQVRRWPLNPLDSIIQYLKSQPDSLRIADLGCGEARLASEVSQTVVHCFDLVSLNDRVVPCDIADIPLPEFSVDVVVFCLSLMGTNYSKFLEEAHRILSDHGQLLVAEVTSRFESEGFATFIHAVQRLGFQYDQFHPLVTNAEAPQSGSVSGLRAIQRPTNRHRNKKARRNSIPGDQVHHKQAQPYFVTFAFVKRSQTRTASSSSFPKLRACTYKRR